MLRHSVSNSDSKSTHSAEFGAVKGIQAAPTTFPVGLNRKIVGKCHPNKVSYRGAWKVVGLTMTGLAQHHSAGKPWMPGLLGGNGKRWAANVTSAAVMALDFDGGLTIEEALENPFIEAYAGLVIESSSSTPELHKFRVVFRLPQPIQGSAAVGTSNQYLGLAKKVRLGHLSAETLENSL